MLAIAALIWFVARRKRSKTVEHTTQGDFVELQPTYDKDIKRPTEQVGQYPVSELQGAHKRESVKPSELWAPHTASELA